MICFCGHTEDQHGHRHCLVCNGCRRFDAVHSEPTGNDGNDDLCVSALGAELFTGERVNVDY